MTLDPKQSHAQSIWWLIAVTAVGWSWWAYEGPFRWLAELQLRVFGAYLLQITFLLSLAVIGVPGSLLIRRFDRARPRTSLPSRWPTLGPEWILVLPAACLMIGCYLFHQARSLQLATIKAGTLEWGQKPSSRWLAIEGRALTDAAVCMSEPVRECYVPLVSPEWTPVVPGAAFIHTRGDVTHLTSGSHQGTQSYTGLPGPVRAIYEGSEMGPPSKSVVVLDLNASPLDSTENALIFLWIGALTLPMTAVALFAQRRRASRVASVVAVSRERARAAGLLDASKPKKPENAPPEQ